MEPGRQSDEVAIGDTASDVDNQEPLVTSGQFVPLTERRTDARRVITVRKVP